MKIELIKKGEGVARKICDTYQVMNFLTKEFNKNVSLAVSEAKKHSETTRNLKSDRIYFRF